MEYKFVRTGSSNLDLPRRRIIKLSGAFLDTDGRLTLIKRRYNRTVPLSLLSVGKDGKPTIDNSLILDTRERFIPLDTTKPYKLNANTSGVCMSSIVWSPTLLVSHSLGQIAYFIAPVSRQRSPLRLLNRTPS